MRRQVPSHREESRVQSIPELPALGHLVTGAESCVIFYVDRIEHRLCPGVSINLSSEFIRVLADKERDERLLDTVCNLEKVKNAADLMRLTVRPKKKVKAKKVSRKGGQRR